ncbi:MAG: biopolymer transporter ExbD [Gammaproteobacteria bacterium]|nr:biopolymer transporter ExbD [Gammaproteobacteria bacterium]
MKFKRRIQEEPSINLTPLIDVVFLLLIFFMVTTTFNRETRLQVNLPKAQTETKINESARLEIVIPREGLISLNGQTLVNGRIETLLRGLELESEGNLDMPVIIIADSEATHQSVVLAMDAIGQAGFDRLSIATQDPEQPATQDACY